MFCPKSSASKCALTCFGSLSLGIARRLGACIGTIGYKLNTRMAKVTRENISICLPELTPGEQEQLVKKSLQETGKTATEVCVIWKQKKCPIKRYVNKITGEELIKNLYDEGKGLIVLAPHLGNWELISYYLQNLGPVCNLYQPPKLKGLEELMCKSRGKAGCELVPANIKGVALLLARLQKGGITGILPDQNPNIVKSGEFIPFFGEPALTITLVPKLIKRTGCNAIFAFAKRNDNGFELVFREVPKDLYSKDSGLALKALNEGVESLVREAPEQYQWEYKRFKNAYPEQTTKRYIY